MYDVQDESWLDRMIGRLFSCMVWLFDVCFITAYFGVCFIILYLCYWWLHYLTGQLFSQR